MGILLSREGFCLSARQLRQKEELSWVMTPSKPRQRL
jgi:hypothetical protein